MYSLRKIISGGQTGVDQAALNAALELNIGCGGRCPPGRVCENGNIPGNLPLTETPVERSKIAPDIPRSLRTEWNVRDSDATLILKPPGLNDDKGTNWTLQCVEIYGKKSLILDPFENRSSNILREWLSTNQVRTLNIAGPDEKTCPGIGEKSYNFLLQALESQRTG